MKNALLISLLVGWVSLEAQVVADSAVIDFQGQLVGWMHYNPDNTYPLYLGGRFIPQATYTIGLNANRALDFKASADLVGELGFHIPNSHKWHGNFSPYRMWARYTTRQMELRLGLQKINFGSATLLRPLMWFDQVDPRDPLQLTDGVWGGLMRYYFMNNANLWVWVLYGNNKEKGWEWAQSHSQIPELGGRFQVPIPLGEAAISYHHRTADSRQMNGSIPAFERIPEHRLGLDARFDKLLGFWLEGAWVHMNRDLGELSNQLTMNLGLDYTFGWGNGLGIIAEHLVTSFDEKAFGLTNAINISALSMNYPFGIFDTVNTIIFYSWDDQKWYNFINWTKQYNTLALNMMAYWNPDDYNMPLQGRAENLFAGKGIQLMLVYNF